MVEINYIRKENINWLFCLSEQNFLLFLTNQYFKTYKRKLKIQAILFQQRFCKVDFIVNVLVKVQIFFLLEIFSVWDHSLQISQSELFCLRWPPSCFLEPTPRNSHLCRMAHLKKEICIWTVGKELLSEVSLHLHHVR